MDWLDELKEEIMVEEVNKNSKIYEEDFLESHIYHTLLDYSDLVKRYGQIEVNKWLTNINAN